MGPIAWALGDEVAPWGGATLSRRGTQVFTVSIRLHAMYGTDQGGENRSRESRKGTRLDKTRMGAKELKIWQRQWMGSGSF